MELAVGSTASLALKLGKLLMEEVVLQKGLKRDIEFLSMELVTINAALVAASAAPPDQLSELDKLWTRQVRELSYDLEDAVDDFILRVAGRESATPTDANIFRKTFSKAIAALKKANDRRQISDKVRDVKKLSNDLAELHTKYTARGLGANRAASASIDPRVINLNKKKSDLVGIEETSEKVIRMLTGTKDIAHSSEKSLKIVSIVGIGGLGKTTLAKTVHEKLKKQFHCCAFISVGRTPNLARTFEKMLAELDEKFKNRSDMARWDLEQFCKELHKFLQHKRYFIVVDDLWDKKSWEAIKYALEDSNCGSRIIMTTRNSEVVTKAEEIYRLKHLSDENSKTLFYKRIRSQEGESIDGLSAEVSSKIIGKCGGVPLAIISISSLLVDRPCEEWPKVYDSIGFGNGDNTMKILSYSYYDLPHYLKPCLLHLSIFPEDSILDTNGLIWMWIGEGFVSLEKEEDSLFEVGERYYKELVNRSMIQPTEDKYDKFTKWFRIHDIVFDLICELSRDEKFVTLLGSREEQALSVSSKRKTKTGMPPLDSKVRRLAVLNHRGHIPEDTMDKPEVLRSLNIVQSDIEIMAPVHRFKVCRVLYIQQSYVSINLKHLGRLLHLKYLEISETETPIYELPKEIGHLKSLQTLLLKDTELGELPPAVCSLTHLMCLIVEVFNGRLPADTMGNLTSLEELRLKSVVGRSATKGLVTELGKMKRLRVVSVTFSQELEESSQKALVQSLCNLQELQELVLSSSGISQPGATIWEDWAPPRKLWRLLIKGIIFSRQPGWINSYRLPLLCFLYLNVDVVEVQDLDNLVRLPELSYLELEGCSWPPGYTVGTDGFKNLRFCHVGTALKIHMGAMPRLEELQFGVHAGHGSFDVNGVPLKQFPTKDVMGDLDFGLDNLLSLEQVTVRVNCSGATAAEVEEVEAVIRHAVEKHPNLPVITMDRICEEFMLSDDEDQEARQNIEELIGVLEWKDEPDAVFISHLRSYQSLQEAVISIDCAGASMCEVEKVEADLRHAAEVHPDHDNFLSKVQLGN